MERAVVQITLFGLLLALVTSLPNKDDWDIYSFHINSTASSRYATTVISSRVANRMNESKEIEFQVRIPKNAFISKFRMFIDGQVYDGVVKGKEKAQEQYTEAVSRGQSAGIVSSVGRTLEEFKTSVNVAAHKKVTFELTYEELLKRRLGKYELQIHARPMQPVKDFKIDVHLIEETGINFIEIKGGLSTGALTNAITITHADKESWVYLYPTEDQQKVCHSCGEQGMNGELVIVYDVNRDTSLGHIKTSDGYFVHHFAPSSLARIPKNVVFLIDKSGSMHGKKIQQTRIALIHILNDLAEEDYFGLIVFEGNIFHWKRELVRANKQNLETAKTFAQGIEASGGTNINDAVLEGARMLNSHPREGSASILILLTDGDPTSGVTNLEVIQSNVRGAIADKFPLYCLGFGFDVYFEFLEKMSLQNNGVARRIYEDSDANLQLTGFYEEVATPLLTDVTMIYNGGTNLTKTNFSQYYNGSEIVVAGQITDNDIESFTPQVLAISRNRKLTFSETNTTVKSTGTVSDRRIQRIWAYLTVKQLLEKELLLSGPEKENVKKEALELSLKYGFVTPLTSMVVTKPQGESTDVLNKPKEGETPTAQLLPGQHPPMLYHQAIGKADATQFRGGHISFTLTGPPGQAIIPIIGSYGGVAVMPDLPVLIPVLDIMTSNVPVQATHAPVSHRFLIKTESQSLPLCFDVTGGLRLKLFHDPDRELTVNGELDSVAYGGFRKIAIHVKTDLYVEIDTSGITVREGQTLIRYSGQDLVLAGRLTMTRRGSEIDVETGGTRIVILIHMKDGQEFLWPVLRQQPSDTSEGILALKPAVYEEVQQSPLTKVKIQDQETDVTRSNAVDYSIVSHPTLDCWLMSAESALQRRLDDFTVTQL
ncbi:inter-alpha-trypsin inhibitor heavy chain H3-like [Plectropomus leopardus]|uniref:inter-alpha-trypsin inhibitor heavy chain H3-like n=1 Tax=Plectropomus leopardus TaxID=160734 RepID=UPI001C4AC198|nr:inter-alpha-trypsin inhibitor heavy chain H3-like [Plectropomus leopardus]